MTIKSSLGVVVGRFQVPLLHAGHLHLLRYAKERNDDLLIALGSGSGLATPRNPLSFAVRKSMLLSACPSATVIEHQDNPSDVAWSQTLDSHIDTLFPAADVTLYGSRDSFIPYYSGKKKVAEVAEIASEDGTAVRQKIKTEIPCTADFRRGIIHAHTTRLPIPYPAVDVAIINTFKRKVLLGQKTTDNGHWRFIGGFFDPTKDTSLEMAARREAAEETSQTEIDGFEYLGSSIIDDWRYRRDDDCIVSTFFKATYIFGSPRPSDDIASLRWIAYERVLESLVPQHRYFGELLLASLQP